MDNMMSNELKDLISDEIDNETNSVEKDENTTFNPLDRRTWENFSPRNLLRSLINGIKFVANFFFDIYFGYFLYFFLVGLLGGLILWGIEGKSHAFIDTFFTMTSAVCVTGLIVLDTHSLNTGSQVWIFLIILIGGEVFCSTYPLFFNLYFAWRNRNVEIPDDAPEKLKEIRRYRLKCTAAILIAALLYWFFVQLTAFAILMVYNVFNEDNRRIYYSFDIVPFFGTLFLCVSAFNNAGFSVFADSVVQFSQKWLPLIVWAILILAGNTAYPIFLRFTFVILHWMFPWCKTFEMVLKYSRVYYTNIFPFTTTLGVIGILIVFNLSQAIITYIFDWDYNLASMGQNWFYKLVDGMFQSISTRTCGLNTIGIASARAPVLVMYVIMMYIANYPVAVAIKGSETRLIEQANKKYGPATSRSALRFVALNDLFIVGLFYLIVSICEVNLILEDSSLTNLFAILFEVVSGYGTVGLSIGFGADVTSLSGRFNTVGKLSMIFLMVLGRCRRLSNKYDSAIWGKAFWEEPFWRDNNEEKLERPNH